MMYALVSGMEASWVADWRYPGKAASGVCGLLRKDVRGNHKGLLDARI